MVCVHNQKYLFQWISHQFDPRGTIEDFNEFQKLPVFYSAWIGHGLHVETDFITVGYLMILLDILKI